MSAELVDALSKKLDASSLDRAEMADAYEGVQRLSYLDPQIRAQVGQRLATVVVNWPRVVVDSLEERLDVEGFRAGGDAADDGLWDLWQQNDLDEWSQMCHLESLLHAQSYAIAWRDRDGLRISVESAAEVSVDRAPTDLRGVRSAVKRWLDGDVWRAALYLPDRVERYAAPATRNGVAPRGAEQWRSDGFVTHTAGVVPVATFTNRPSLHNLHGRSEIADVIPPAQAVYKLLTDMMVSSEHTAQPRRWATGLEVPEGPDRERLQAEAAAYWDAATKGKTWLAGQGVNFGQFPAGDLNNFVQAIGMLTGQIAAIAGLPPHYLGVNADNPASADAIRSAEASLVKRARRKQRQFGGSWERIMRVAKALELGTSVDALPAEYATVETIWRDPETPTVAQSADAALKLVQGGVITAETGQEVYLGFTPAQIEQDRTRRMESAVAPVQAQLDLADRLQRERNLTPNASLAASGLIQAAALNSAESATS